MPLKKKIKLAKNFSLQPYGDDIQPKYKARQTVPMAGADAELAKAAWRALTRQMLRAGYISIAPRKWWAGGYSRSFVPAISVLTSLQRRSFEAVEPMRRRAERRAYIRPGSERSNAPRFDEDSFSKIMTKLTALGFWAVLLMLLIKTEINIAGLTGADTQEPIVKLLSGIATGAKPVLTLILIAMAFDPALYIGNRLWGQFGWSRVPVVATLWGLFFIAGVSLFGVSEIMRQLNTEIERVNSTQP